MVKGKNIKVNKDPKSDWLVFDWRQLTWKKEEVNYLIEIYPNFDSGEKIESWTLYAAAYYDLEDQRFYISKKIADSVPFRYITKNALDLFTECYNYISKIDKREIPPV